MITVSQLKPITGSGQAIWYDDLSRELLEEGKLTELVQGGVTGLTSNPTIFDNAISKSNRYDAEVIRLFKQGLSAAQICESLFIEDVGAAADLLLPVYERTAALDGYASLEVSPELAHDFDGTVAAARNLWSKLNRKNAMIKVPATDAGVKALTTLTAEGVNVNMTLIFSVERYEQVLSAFLKGIEARMAAGESVQSVASVASFFVSRLDSLVSAKLKALGKDEALVEGRIAVANCRLAYDSFLQVKQQRSVDLEKGVQIQKPLWASTSTKSPRLKPTYYVEQLIADQTVNTMPPQTLLACSAGLEAGSLLSMSVEEARQCVAELEAQGVSLSAVCEELVVDGIQKFIDSYRSLLKSIETKCEQLISGQS